MKFTFVLLLVFILILLSTCCGTLNKSLMADLNSQKYKYSASADTSLCLPKPLPEKIIYVPLRILQWTFYGIGIVCVMPSLVSSALGNDEDDSDYEYEHETEEEQENSIDQYKLLGIGVVSFVIGAVFDDWANSMLASSKIKKFKMKLKPKVDKNKQID